MDWGQYLSRGVQRQPPPSAPLDNDATQPMMNEVTAGGEQHPQSAAEEASPDADLALRRLEKALQTLGLSAFTSRMTLQFIASRLQMQRNGAEELHRVISYLLALVNPNPQFHIDMRRGREGCGQIIPHLRSQPFWDHVDDFQPLIRRIQTHIAAIREELLGLRHAPIQGCDVGALEKDGEIRRFSASTAEVLEREPAAPRTVTAFQAYRSPGTRVVDQGEWNVCYLSLHGLDFSRNASRCPATMGVVEPSDPGTDECCHVYGHAFFSALSPDAFIAPHFGPTNKKLRVYVPLFVPENQCYLEVNGIRRTLRAGEPIIFDDSFRHSAANMSPSEPRLNLIFDIWHPDLSATERKVLNFINKGQQSTAKRLKKQHELDIKESTKSLPGGESSDDFLSLIEASGRDGLSPESLVNVFGSYDRSLKPN